MWSIIQTISKRVLLTAVLIGSTQTIFADEMGNHSESLTPTEEAKIDRLISNLNDLNNRMIARESASILGPDDTTNPDPFPSDPSNPGGFDPNFDWSNLDPTGASLTQKNGSAELIAAYVMLQTFRFYGVTYYFKKDGARIDFRIISSTKGYFTSLTKLDIAFAIREFGRFLKAHLCGNATPENFYRLFSQIPQVGLRFKYDMAWVLLGNNLPKEPNAVYKLGSRWSTLSKIVSSTGALRSGDGIDQNLRGWMGGIKDIVTILTQLNGLICYVDLRPVPREEIKKRVVIKKLLDMQVEMNNEFQKYKDIFDKATRTGVTDQINSLRMN